MPFRLDHISYAASHDQVIDVVQRLGSRIGSAFTDGGIHPRFGTRNFTLPLRNGHYIEVVCPLEHPAAESTPFGKAVTQRVNRGGGWMTWVVATDDISPVESRLGRSAVEGSRKKPDGSELKWKQIGLLGTLEDSQLPFFIQWDSKFHPSTEEKPLTAIKNILVSGEKEKVKKWIGIEPSELCKDVEITWHDPGRYEGESGIISVIFETPRGEIVID